MINIKGIKNFGEMHYCGNDSGIGSRVANNLLRDVFHKFFINCKRYYDSVEKAYGQGELLFMFKERQIHSALSPSFFSETECHLTEVPLSRKIKKLKNKKRIKIKKGWVDYWCQNGRNPIDYFIEIKHSFNCATTPNPRKSLIDSWKDGIKQINSIKSSVTEWIAGKGAIPMVILISPFWVNGSKIDEVSNETIQAQHDTILSSLTPTPNWNSLFFVNKAYHGPFEYTDGVEYNPAVGIYSYKEDIISN